MTVCSCTDMETELRVDHTQQIHTMSLGGRRVSDNSQQYVCVFFVNN